MMAPALWALGGPSRHPGERGVGGMSTGDVLGPACLLASVSMLSTLATYVYHWFRFSRTEALHAIEILELEAAPPLTHVVVVCAYSEPLEVLERTFESIAAQRGLQNNPIAVLASEARDHTRHNSFAHLQSITKGRLSICMTEHELEEGEPAGKASNENFAVRAVHRKLIDDLGLDPFEVIITIADADSVFSETYLAQVGTAYCNEPDGRRLIYKGPLNVYRNFSDAGLLVQSLELARCHADAFHGLFSVPYPYSNYSLALGFASEIGFWTPDAMPEDIHTANKAIVNSFGSRTTVLVNAVICNDLVPTIGERYAQAKRHQWGSLTELAWVVALWTETGLRFPAWWAVFASESQRSGSLPSAVMALACYVQVSICVYFVGVQGQVLPAHVRPLLWAAGVSVLWSWIWFWVAELAYWNTVMRQFPAQRPSACRWALLVLASPLAYVVNNVLFFILPTLHALCHAAFAGHELVYRTAPKGDAARRPLCGIA
uniref:Glycosyltransferase 2-like domain-containing protein n=1 Tax=Zooxanthella nutricula TaxID=1333877 RepID=A0A7S2JNP7_9DINO